MIRQRDDVDGGEVGWLIRAVLADMRVSPHPYCASRAECQRERAFGCSQSQHSRTHIFPSCLVELQDEEVAQCFQLNLRRPAPSTHNIVMPKKWHSGWDLLPR